MLNDGMMQQLQRKKPQRFSLGKNIIQNHSVKSELKLHQKRIQNENVNKFC